MTKATTLSYSDRLIPLSWSKTSLATPFSPKKLHLTSGAHFVPFARVGNVLPEKYLQSLTEFMEQKRGILFRGASGPLVEEIRKTTPLIALPLGSEATLSLQEFQPTSSLLSLSRRGLRKGDILEVAPRLAGNLLHRYRNQWQKRSSTRLRGLFQRFPLARQRCFVYQGYSSDGIALITLSERSKGALHLELLNRSSNAPVGAVESLLLFAIDQLKKENVRALSLGEVPLVLPKEIKEKNRTNFALRPLFSLGKKALSNSYSIDGLYKFKNKFHPTWKSVYWVMNHRVRPRDIYEVLDLTGVLSFFPRALFLPS